MFLVYKTACLRRTEALRLPVDLAWEAFHLLVCSLGNAAGFCQALVLYFSVFCTHLSVYNC